MSYKQIFECQKLWSYDEAVFSRRCTTTYLYQQNDVKFIDIKSLPTKGSKIFSHSFRPNAELSTIGKFVTDEEKRMVQFVDVGLKKRGFLFGQIRVV